MRFEVLNASKDQEVYQAIQSGEVIEDYSDDKPYPSVLIYGNSNNGKL